MHTLKNMFFFFSFELKRETLNWLSIFPCKYKVKRDNYEHCNLSMPLYKTIKRRWVWALSGWIPWGAKEWCHLRECSPSFSKFTSLINLIGQLIMEIYKRKSMSIDEVLRDKWAIRKRKCQRCESHWYFPSINISFSLFQYYTCSVLQRI